MLNVQELIDTVERAGGSFQVSPEKLAYSLPAAASGLEPVIRDAGVAIAHFLFLRSWEPPPGARVQ